MYDFQIAHIEHVTVSPAAGRRYPPPNISITSQHFSSGFASAFTAALTDVLTSDRVLTDEEVIDAVKMIFEDETPPTDNEIAHAVGALVGLILAKA